MSRDPLKSVGGCPINILPLNKSQDGRADPSAKRAERASSLSESVKASAGNVNSTILSSSKF